MYKIFIEKSAIYRAHIAVAVALWEGNSLIFIIYAIASKGEKARDMCEKRNETNCILHK